MPHKSDIQVKHTHIFLPSFSLANIQRIVGPFITLMYWNRFLGALGIEYIFRHPVAEKDSFSSSGKTTPPALFLIFKIFVNSLDRVCDLVVRVHGWRRRCSGSIPGATRFSNK
jgi:hypothetical protein